MNQTVDLRDWVSANHPDFIGLGHSAGDHTCEVGRLMDPVVKNGKILPARPETRTHQIRSRGIVLGNFSGGAFDTEHFSNQKMIPLLRIFPHHPLIIGVCNIF